MRLRGCFWFGRSFLAFLVSLAVAVPASIAANNNALVPGTGTHIDYVGDTLEEPDWKFVHNHPKSSYKTDNQRRLPGAKSANGLWFEGQERGQPDSLRTVPVPAGALPGSNYALEIKTLNSGIPGFHSNKVEQDDLVVTSVERIGVIPASESPSMVIRLYLPPVEEWEQRTGPHFGFRAQVTTTVTKSDSQQVGRFRSRPNSYQALEPYWPGMWVHFRRKADLGTAEDAAALTVRGDRWGVDMKVKDIPLSQFGWWTLGMSITPDGMIHYFARPGVENLTAADHLTSQFPYSYRAEKFESMFFNICNKDDGKTWSTAFLIDDPKFYLVRSERVQSTVQSKQRTAAAKQSRK
jgi:hypothetical protein